MSRLLVSPLVAALLAGALLAGGAAGAAPPVPPLPSVCGSELAARFTETATDGPAHRITVVLTNTGRVACALAGFPALVVPGAPADALPVGHVTLLYVVVIAPGSDASFEVRYVTAAAPAGAACSLSVTVNETGSAAEGTIPLAACASITRIDVTSYALGKHPLAIPPALPAGPALPACLPADLHLREVRTAPAGRLASHAIYALQNRGAACRFAAGAALRLLDADAKAISVRYVPRATTAHVVALAPGAEASLTVRYEPPVPASCPPASMVTIGVASDPAAIGASATIMGCAGAVLRVSDLRLGVPLPPGLLRG
jgi:hypothetical protein